MHLGITGGSSLTGSSIAAFFHRNDWKVSALFTKPSLADYSPLQRQRIETLPCDLCYGIRVEDDSCAQWIRKHQPDLWIHHHHYMEDFRSKAYDYHRANAVCIEPLERIVDALDSSGCKRIIYSGTYFEEPRQEQIEEFYPYVVSKLQVWAELLALCAKRDINIGKVVIPNVVDPFENRDRALPDFYEHVVEGREFQLHSPDNIIDSLPAGHLAQTYFHTALQLTKVKIVIDKPSGWRGTMIDWLQFANSEIAKRLDVPLVKIKQPSHQSVATSYFNTDDIDINWSLFWDRYVAQFDHDL